jgi:7-carboxy-7-deazaguanine synthase
MSYSVKEVYYTLQGEGFYSGRAAVFVRFTGCNLWSGRESDRETAVCTFCDTDFVGTDGPGGGRFDSAGELAHHVAGVWKRGAVGLESVVGTVDETVCTRPFVVCTGGEPLLQLDSALVGVLHDVGFEIAVETNGTIPAPEDIDWICVSPKRDARLVQSSGDELKLVFPQEEALPEQFENLDFDHFYVQPMDGAAIEANTRAALEYCLTHPRWKLSLQTHKLLQIP